MFNVKFAFDNVEVKSVDKSDLFYVYRWIKENKVYEGKESSIEFNEFYDRFLEYYIGEGEVFLKICINDNIIGILKGRIEFKSSNEFWILFFRVNNSFRKKNIDVKIINELMKYFISYGIDKFYVLVSSEEKQNLSFWNKNGFMLMRVCENFVNNIKKEKAFILVNDKS